jgi:hypothetical protein
MLNGSTFFAIKPGVRTIEVFSSRFRHNKPRQSRGINELW